MSKNFDYSVELDKIMLEENEITRDNIIAIQRSIEKIQRIIDDLDNRLEQAGF